MIEFRSATLGYDDHKVIAGLSMRIEKNKRYAIIGPSGCGKTTLLYGMAGIIKPVDGMICIAGNPIKKSRKETSIILQEYGLFPWKTVWQNMTLPLIIRNALSEEAITYCHKLLGELGLSEKSGSYPSQLSGGQKQRVAIARSWSTMPDLLLMDEPFSSLDAMTREGLQESVLEFQKKSEMTLVVVTHSIEEAVYLAEFIIAMSSEGTIEDIVENPNQGPINYRDSKAFYEMCLSIRKVLKGGKDDL